MSEPAAMLTAYLKNATIKIDDKISFTVYVRPPLTCTSGPQLIEHCRKIFGDIRDKMAKNDRKRLFRIVDEAEYRSFRTTEYIWDDVYGSPLTECQPIHALLKAHRMSETSTTL